MQYPTARFVSLFVVVLSLSACGPTDRCAGVVCSAGMTCAAEDGLCHCGEATGPVCSEAALCAGGSCLEPECGAPVAWAPGMRAFEEVTSEVGLDGVEGTRVQASDFDGDGWTDLLIRRGPAGSDVFEEGGARFTYLLLNEGGRFVDRTQESGLVQRRAAGEGGRPNEVMAFADVDADGDTDVWSGVNTVALDTVNMGATSELLLNDGTGRFTLTAEDNPIRNVERVDTPGGGSFADVDLDGDIDLWVGSHEYSGGAGGARYMQSLLWLNDGMGRFADGTDAAGLTTVDWVRIDDIDAGLAHSRAWSSTACDLNGDRLPELMVASYGRAPNLLFQATREGGAVRYVNRGVASGYAFDGDQTWQDNQFARCFCQSSPTAEGCDTVTAVPLIACDTPNWSHATDRHPFRLGGNSGATTCGDLDNDGDLDLVTSEIRHWWAGGGSDGAEILVNTGEADVRFERPGREATGLVVPHADATVWDEGIMTNAVLDFDNDGWLDVYLGASDYPGNHGLLYHHESGPLAYSEVPISDGIDHHRSHGVIALDYDRDGDLDLLVGHSRARCGAPDDCYETQQVRLFENVLGGNHVQLVLEGREGANRSAIGARVRITAGGITQTREVGGGHGHFGGQGDFVVHAGLGAACEAEVEITWPDAEGTTETYTIPAGHRVRATLGEGLRPE